MLHEEGDKRNLVSIGELVVGARRFYNRYLELDYSIPGNKLEKKARKVITLVFCG